MRCLIVGDHSIQREVASLLSGSQHEISDCSPLECFTKITFNRPDVIIIDLRKGFSDFRQLQESCQSADGDYAPILVGLTAHETHQERCLRYYDLGFEIVLEFPLNPDLLITLIKVFARRSGIGENTVQSTHLMLNNRTRDCFLKTNRGELLSFFKATPMQFGLISLLVKSPRRVWQKEELELALPSSKSPRFDNRAVDTSINRLRERMSLLLSQLPEDSWEKSALYKYPFIQTEHGLGYYFLDCLHLQGDGEASFPMQSPIRQAGLQIQPNHQRQFPFLLEDCRYYQEG